MTNITNNYISLCVFLFLSITFKLTLCQQSWDDSCGTSKSDSFEQNVESKPMCFKFKNIMPGTGGGNKYYFSVLTDEYTLVNLVDCM